MSLSLISWIGAGFFGIFFSLIWKKIRNILINTMIIKQLIKLRFIHVLMFFWTEGSIAAPYHGCFTLLLHLSTSCLDSSNIELTQIEVWSLMRCVNVLDSNTETDFHLLACFVSDPACDQQTFDRFLDPRKKPNRFFFLKITECIASETSVRPRDDWSRSRMGAP